MRTSILLPAVLGALCLGGTASAQPAPPLEFDTVAEFLARYGPPELARRIREHGSDAVRFSYAKYDWTLNAVP